MSYHNTSCNAKNNFQSIRRLWIQIDLEIICIVLYKIRKYNDSRIEVGSLLMNNIHSGKFIINLLRRLSFLFLTDWLMNLFMNKKSCFFMWHRRVFLRNHTLVVSVNKTSWQFNAIVCQQSIHHTNAKLLKGHYEQLMIYPVLITRELFTYKESDMANYSGLNASVYDLNTSLLPYVLVLVISGQCAMLHSKFNRRAQANVSTNPSASITERLMRFRRSIICMIYYNSNSAQSVKYSLWRSFDDHV